MFINIAKVSNSIPDYSWGASKTTAINWLYPEPFTVTSSNREMVGYTEGMTDLVIPATFTDSGRYYKVVAIGTNAFYQCDYLTSITIPNTVKDIEKSAFYDCPYLQNVTFEEGSQLVSIGEHAFDNCDRLRGIIIPSSVTSIGRYAFSHCYYPYAASAYPFVVTFEETSKLAFIGSHAFRYCYIESITIPSSVTSIEENAFGSCSKLPAIDVDEANSNYTSVDGVLYSKDLKTLVQYPAGKDDTSYTVPSTSELLGY